MGISRVSSCLIVLVIYLNVNEISNIREGRMFVLLRDADELECNGVY